MKLKSGFFRIYPAIIGRAAGIIFPAEEKVFVQAESETETEPVKEQEPTAKESTDTDEQEFVMDGTVAEDAPTEGIETSDFSEQVEETAAEESSFSEVNADEVEAEKPEVETTQ